MDKDTHFQDADLPSDDGLVGKRFESTYDILQLLGKGGMASVYKAYASNNKQLVAIKIMHSRHQRDAMTVQRFKTEAAAVSRIKHKNVIEILNVGMSSDDRPFIVMEYLEGMSLADLVRSCHRLTIADALPIFDNICEALAQAHSQGIIHRDVKPSNVMLANLSHNAFIVKVVDFGIAKVFPQAGDNTFTETATGEIFGSPPYMSPEQCTGQKLDSRSDIYSLGCLMYEVLMGEPPLLGVNPMSTMYKQANEPPKPLSLPSEDHQSVLAMDFIIEKTLQKAPENRYQTAGELLEALSKVRRSSGKATSTAALIHLALKNRWRSAKRAFGATKTSFIVTIITLVGCFTIFIFFIWNDLFVHEPSFKGKMLVWRTAPAASLISWQRRYKYTTELQSAQKLISNFNQLDNSSSKISNPEILELHKKVGDLLFEDNCYEAALLHYSKAISLGLQLFSSSYSNYQPIPSVVHDLGESYTRLAECQLLMRDPLKAHKTAMEGLNWSISDNTKEDGYKIYLCYVLGASICVLNGSTVQMNDFFDKVLIYVEQKGLGPLVGREIAPALSVIGDCAFKNGEWRRAIKAYSAAQIAWSSLKKHGQAPAKTRHDEPIQDYWERADFGDYNAAVCDVKIGDSLMHLQHYDDAKINYEKSMKFFGTNESHSELEKSIVLFKEANSLWCLHNFSEAILVRHYAIKSWLLAQQHPSKLKE